MKFEKNDVLRQLETMTMRDILKEYNIWQKKKAEAFSHGFLEDLEGITKVVGWIEDYICQECEQ